MNGSHLAIGAVAALASAGLLGRRGSLLFLQHQEMLVFDNQRLRNLTTGKIHTNFDDVVEDLQKIFGDKYKTTSMTAGALNNAIRPWLMAQGLDDRFWDGRYDVTHTGTTQLHTPTPDEREEIGQRYGVELRRRGM